MKRWIQITIGFMSVIAACTAWAAELVLKPVKVAPDMYAVIGDLGSPSYENEGQNSNLGFIVTPKGVIVINSGASTRVAKALHSAIQTVTKQPVKYVINVNSQPHYWMGNGYFEGLNVPIIAHKEAGRFMREAGDFQLDTTKKTLKERAEGTRIAYPTELIDKTREISLGGLKVQVLALGSAHTPGDVAVWIPSRKVLFAGDVIYTERLLAVLPNGSSAGWIKAFDSLMALNPATIVPGHGKSATAKQAVADTRDYLEDLRTNAKKILDQGGTLQDAAEKIDQSRYKNLVNYDLLARRNAHQIFTEVEKESF